MISDQTVMTPVLVRMSIHTVIKPGGYFFGGWVGGVGWLEKWRIKLTSAKVEVEVDAELGKSNVSSNTDPILTKL